MCAGVGVCVGVSVVLFMTANASGADASLKRPDAQAFKCPGVRALRRHGRRAEVPHVQV